MINYVIFLYEACELKDFDFWGGAEEIAEKINNLPNANDCWAFLEERIPDDYGDLTETDVNDYVYSDAWPLLEENGFVEVEQQ